MSQHDYNIANASGAVVRADINTLAQAIATLNAGASAPSPSFANMLWYDTATGILYKRDSANTIWTPFQAVALTFARQAMTGLSLHTFTGIPAGARRVTALITVLSAGSGTGTHYVRIGDSTGVLDTGYLSNIEGIEVTAGFPLNTAPDAGTSFATQMTITKQPGANVWIASANVLRSGASTGVASMTGYATLAGDLDRVRLIVIGGATFDAGFFGLNVEY